MMIAKSDQPEPRDESPKGCAVNEILTPAEIESRFESEWVLLENVQMSDNGEILSGAVIYHSKDRDEVYRKAVELRPKRFATLYTGKMPADSAIVL